MSIQFQIEEMPDYLAAKFTGAGAAEEIWRRFEVIAGLSAARIMRSPGRCVDVLDAWAT
jgi:hypothetical protein